MTLRLELHIRINLSSSLERRFSFGCQTFDGQHIPLDRWCHREIVAPSRVYVNLMGHKLADINNVLPWVPR